MRSYNRETIAASNIEKNKMSFILSFLFYATLMVNPILNSRIIANYDKVDEISANKNILIKMIVSLL